MSILAFARTLAGHVTRAAHARMPILSKVLETSEHEVCRAGERLRDIREKSRQQVLDFEAACQRLGRGLAGNDGAAAGATLNQALEGPRQAHQAFLELGRTLDVQLAAQQDLAQTAAGSVQEIAQIATQIHEIGLSATLVTLNARIEASRLGQGGRAFTVIADELRQLTAVVQGMSKDIARISEQLMRLIPDIAQRATALRESHHEAAQAIGARLDEASKQQTQALQTMDEALRAGQQRADEIVMGLHEVVAMLQFQGLNAQDLTGVVRQDAACTQLITRTLTELGSSQPRIDEFEKLARRAESISHALTDREHDARVAAKAQSNDGPSPAPGDALLFE